MRIRYYEATNKKLKIKLASFLKQTEEVRQKRFRFSRRVGGKRTAYIETTHGFAIVFSESKLPDETLWRRMKGSGPECWRPRLSTKQGKALDREMDAMQLPSMYDLCRVIGMTRWVGMTLRSPGVESIGNRIFISTPEDYRPIIGLKRVSDVAMERVTASAN